MNDCDHCLSAHAQIIEIVSLSVQFLPTNLVHDVAQTAIDFPAGSLASAGGVSAAVRGALLLLGLIAAPAEAAHRLTTRPFRALALSVAFTVLAMWVGPGLSYAVAVLPHGFAILAVASACYVVVLAVTTKGGAATG